MLDLDKSKKYLLALSGGPDSMALLTILVQENYSFIACLINYHHREESDNEASCTKKYVESLGKTIIIYDAHYQKGNFEGWARNFRYQMFAKTIAEYNLDACLVAHQQDDLLETYFLQKERGYVSYYGLQKECAIKGVKIVRPLLSYTKKELETICINNHVPYFIDQTNYDITLKRNYYRHEVINNLTDNDKKTLLLEIEEKNITLYQMYQKLDKVNDYNDFLRLSTQEQDYYLYDLIHQYDEDIVLSKRRLLDLKQKISKDGNVKIPLNNQIALCKEYSCLHIVKTSVVKYKLKVEAPCLVENEYFTFDLINCSKNMYINDEDYPLTIEILQKEDQIKIGNIYKTGSRFFIDNKIKLTKRQYWPKIVSSNGKILFVPRKEFDDKFGAYRIK